MKKLLLAAILISGFTFGQTFSEIQKYSKFYNKPIGELEKFMKVKPKIKDEKLGITTIFYEIGNYNIVAKENIKNNGLIGEITVYSDKKEKAEKAESNWYEAYNFYSKNPEYKEIESSLDDKKKNYSTKELKAEEMVNLLRSLDSTDDISYGLNYKKGSVNYAFFVLGNTKTFYFNVK